MRAEPDGDGVERSDLEPIENDETSMAEQKSRARKEYTDFVLAQCVFTRRENCNTISAKVTFLLTFSEDETRLAEGYNQSYHTNSNID